MARRRQQFQNRFDNYREILARFNSTGTCGHEIKKDDRIGYHAALKKTMCTACWTHWCNENREARAYEETGSDCSYDW